MRVSGAHRGVAAAGVRGARARGAGERSAAARELAAGPALQAQRTSGRASERKRTASQLIAPLGEGAGGVPSSPNGAAGFGAPSGSPFEARGFFFFFFAPLFCLGRRSARHACRERRRAATCHSLHPWQAQAQAQARRRTRTRARRPAAAAGRGDECTRWHRRRLRAATRAAPRPSRSGWSPCTSRRTSRWTGEAGALHVGRGAPHSLARLLARSRIVVVRRGSEQSGAPARAPSAAPNRSA